MEYFILKISLVWLQAAIIIFDKATKISLYSKKGDKDKKSKQVM